jgi:hypothetical protein
MKETDRLLAEIESMPLDAAMQEKAAVISEHVLMSEYQKALETVNHLLN